MVINNPTFVTSVANPQNLYKSDLPQIAILGKSNVGKSSFINFITNRNKLAKTSNTPGLTKLINYFNIDEKLLLVDLPGFGYAKVNKAEKQKWGELIEQYLLNEHNIKRVLHLMDIRHLPGENDILMINFMYHYAIPFNVVLTKSDKLSRSNQVTQKRLIANAIRMTENDIFVTSSAAKSGKEEILNLFEHIINL